jgi:pyruvate dehydrogenase E1 component alpha subunit
MDQELRPSRELSPGDYDLSAHDDDALIKMYRTMRKIREFELAAEDLMEQGVFPGAVHLYLGQEAVATGVCQALHEDDIIGSTHRGHGHVLAKGADEKEMMAELGAKKTGSNDGRGGSMHMVDFSKGIFGTNGIVGASVPHVAGGLLSSRMDGDDRVGVAFFGDGGANQGVVLETMNLASQWDIPVVFLCENNRYAISTPVTKSTAGDRIADRALGFGMPGETVDGQNVLEVNRTVSEEVEGARAGGGPRLVECRTYRMHGHFSGEKALFANRDKHYRDEGEVDEWKELRDPLESFGNALVNASVMSTDERSDIDEEYETLIEGAVEEMENADYPPAEDTVEDVYADQDYPGIPAPKYR